MDVGRSVRWRVDANIRAGSRSECGQEEVLCFTAHAESLLLNIVLPDSTTLACTFKYKIKLLCFWSKVISADLNGV